MEYGGYLFTKVELPEYDIIVPFVCTCCGWCCEHYLPRFTEREILKIAEDAHRQRDETLKQYLEGYEKKRHGRDVSCIFLLANGRCGIHNHPLRPEVCRLYPFSFRSSDERCPAYRDHRRIINALVEGARSFSLYDSSFCPDMVPRPISGEAWPEVWRRFIDAGPPPDLIPPFVHLNFTPPTPEAHTGDGPSTASLAA